MRSPTHGRVPVAALIALLVATLARAEGTPPPASPAVDKPADRAPAVLAQPMRPDLTGHWILNEKQSITPSYGGRRGMEGGGRGGMRGGVGGMGGGLGGMVGGRRGMRGEPGAGEAARPRAGGLPPGVNDLTVERLDAGLLLSQRGRALSAIAFGDTAALAGQAPADVPRVQARWQEGRLLFHSENDRGGRRTETWEVSPDGRQLIVTTSVQRPGGDAPIEFKRVFDRKDSE